MTGFSFRRPATAVGLTGALLLFSQIPALANDVGVKWKNGFQVYTTDGTHSIGVGGRIHYDSYWFKQDDNTPDVYQAQDGFRLRRGRLRISGHIYKNIIFKNQWDFAAVELAVPRDMYIGLRDVPVLGTIRVGQQYEPFSLEFLTSSNYLVFLERAAAVSLAPQRNAGLAANNTAANQRITWAAGVYKEEARGNISANPTGSQKAFTGRITGLPLEREDGRKLLHIGGAFSIREPADGTARFRVKPEQGIGPTFLDTGQIPADNVYQVGLEVATVLGRFSAQAEYMASIVDGPQGSGSPTFPGVYALGSFFLTGEHRQYKKSSGTFTRNKVHKNFHDGTKGGSGAVELTARYSYTSLDDEAEGAMFGSISSGSFGANWYLNPSTRFMLNYVLAHIQTPGDGGDRPPYDGEEHILGMRFQIDV